MSWSEQRGAPAAGEVMRQQTLRATLAMAGRQHTEVTVQHPGTLEAAVTVRIGRVLVYLHTQSSAERFAKVWTDAQTDALRLAQHARRHPVRDRAPEVAEPSMVVHVAGRPAASRWLVNLPDQQRADHLLLRIDELSFAVYDRYAFLTCTEAFATAHRAAREHLPQVDLRNIAPIRSDPGLAGRDAERAASAGLGFAGHSAARTADAALRPTRTAADPARRSAIRLGLRRPALAPTSEPRQNGHQR